MKVEAIPGRAEEALPGLIDKERPELIFSCVDNFASRLFLSRVATKKGIALIDGATGPRAGHVAVYQPGVTPPLEQQLDLA